MKCDPIVGDRLPLAQAGNRILLDDLKGHGCNATPIWGGVTWVHARQVHAKRLSSLFLQQSIAKSLCGIRHRPAGRIWSGVLNRSRDNPHRGLGINRGSIIGACKEWQC